jgi:hypothetical protein
MKCNSYIKLMVEAEEGKTDVWKSIHKSPHKSFGMLLHKLEQE